MKLTIERNNYQYWLMDENGKRIAVFDSDCEDYAVLAKCLLNEYINEPAEKTAYFEREGLIG